MKHATPYGTHAKSTADVIKDSVGAGLSVMIHLRRCPRRHFSLKVKAVTLRLWKQ